MLPVWSRFRKWMSCPFSMTSEESRLRVTTCQYPKIDTTWNTPRIPNKCMAPSSTSNPHPPPTVEAWHRGAVISTKSVCRSCNLEEAPMATLGLITPSIATTKENRKVRSDLQIVLNDCSIYFGGSTFGMCFVPGFLFHVFPTSISCRLPEGWHSCEPA